MPYYPPATAAPASQIATSGTPVDISSTAPSVNQVLTASSGTAAAWVTPSGGAGPTSYVLTSAVTVNTGATTIFTVSSVPTGSYNVSLSVYHIAGATNATHTWGLGFSGTVTGGQYMTYFSAGNAFGGSANVRCSRAQVNTINLTTGSISASGFWLTQVMGGFTVTASGDLSLVVTSDTSDSTIGPGTAISLFKV